jgi:hypothetical protein
MIFDICTEEKTSCFHENCFISSTVFMSSHSFVDMAVKFTCFYYLQSHSFYQSMIVSTFEYMHDTMRTWTYWCGLNSAIMRLFKKPICLNYSGFSDFFLVCPVISLLGLF